MNHVSSTEPPSGEGSPLDDVQRHIASFPGFAGVTVRGLTKALGAPIDSGDVKKHKNDIMV